MIYNLFFFFFKFELGTNFGSGSSINGIHVNDVIHVVYGRLLVEDDQPSEEKQDVFVARECSVVQPNTVIRCITSPGAGLAYKLLFFYYYFFLLWI